MKINQADIEETLITKSEISERIKVLGNEIDAYYSDLLHADENLIVLGILNGSAVFMSDLIRELQTHIAIDWMSLSSYGSGTKSSGVVRVLKDLTLDVKGKHILIAEDILDSGLTLSWLVKNLKTRDVASVEIVSLLKKDLGKAHDKRVSPKWVGFDIPNKFVVGYGLDYADRYRNLPYIGVLSPKVYE